jgi:uncharacterized protein
MMSSAPDTMFARLLRKLAQAVYRHPRWFFYPQMLLFLAGLLYTVQHLEFHTDRNDLVGSEKRYHQNFLRLKEEFPTQDDLVVVVESENLEKNRQFVERLGARLEAEPDLFTDVFYKGDLRMMGSKALLFVPEESLAEMLESLQDFRPFIEQFAQATNLNSFFKLVNQRFRTARAEANPENQALLNALPALERIVGETAGSLRQTGTPASPGINLLFGAGPEAEREMYITFAEGRLYLVTARARHESLNANAIERLRELVHQIQADVPGLNVGLTGEPVLEYDEMVQAQKDTSMASMVALVLCAMIFIFGYYETGRPLKASLCLLVGLGYTMAFTTFFIGHLNILTITFAPILIGLAIDFGVHLITRYEEELRHGQTEQAAIERAFVHTGQGIFTGAFTTAGAFFAMAWTDFKGIQEMGIICGAGMLLCLIPMMTLLPVLLLRGRQNVIDHTQGERLKRRAQIEQLWLSRPVHVVVATIVFSAVCVLQFRNVYFDYNLLNMQSKNLPAVVYEHKLIDSASKSVLFAAVVADTLEESKALIAKLEELPAVAGVDSMAEFLTQDQSEKLGLVRRIKQEAELIQFAPVDPSPVNVSDLSRTLWSLQGYLGLAIKQVKQDEPELAVQFAGLRDSIGNLRRALVKDEAVAARQVQRFQQALFGEVRQLFDSLRNQDDSAPLEVADLPEPLRNRFVGVTGKHLLQVYPNQDIWQRPNQAEFVRQLRTLDEDVTGTPVQLYEYTTLLLDSYLEAARYALIAIAILVFIHFRSPVAVVLALLPVGLGAVWLLGVMGFAGIPLNPANVMTLPLVIGIGVTNGIHILNRFGEERNPAIFGKSTGKAVVVSGLTTIAGFGSLLLAQHQGISSLGLVMSLGVTTCMIAGLTFLPAVLLLLSQAGWRLKKPSDDNALSPLGSEEPEVNTSSIERK